MAVNPPKHHCFTFVSYIRGSQMCSIPHDRIYCDFFLAVICCHLQAELAKIKNLEVEEMVTKNHDIAYYLKVAPHLLIKFEEGDVVGFFESSTGNTYIDFLTFENSSRARMAGVISRSAFLKGRAGHSDGTGKFLLLLLLLFFFFLHSLFLLFLMYFFFSLFPDCVPVLCYIVTALCCECIWSSSSGKEVIRAYVHFVFGKPVNS